MIKQNTPEWLEMRKNMIGASDSPIIMGKSPYKTPYQLWEEKLGLCPNTPQSSAMRRGQDLEEEARRSLEKHLGTLLLPEVRVHSSIPWMMASLDGVDPEDKYIVEIKCPNKEDHAVALGGNVPEKYIPQLQHQLEVCGAEMSYYFSYHISGTAIVKVYRDDRYIKNIIEKEEQFWECMQKKSPPELDERDYIFASSKEWDDAARKWHEVSTAISELEIKEKSLRNTLISLAGNRNAVGSGVMLTRSIRKGSVDYNNIPQLKGVDLENYRKSPIECFSLKYCN